MGHSHHKWEYKEKLPRLKILWDKYIDTYFKGNKTYWEGKAEPYIFYKHLFRKFLDTKVNHKERIRDFEEMVIGTRPNNSTIYHSLNQDPNTFKLTKKQITDVIKFLNKYYNETSIYKLKLAIEKYIDRGYTTHDVARHCLVHVDAIKNILNGNEIPHNIERQIEKELNHET